MAKAMDNLRKQTKATSKQNRTKRREKKMKEYGRTSYNSSDKAYIDGNYKKVASNVAYGYNQGIKKGEITRGSDNDWLRDDAIRKNTQIKYNKSWDGYSKLTGELPKYSVLSSSKKDAKNVLEHANTFRLDGLKTAKQRAKSRNGIGKALEYGSGFLKDTIVDPVVDLMRGADLVGSAMTGAGLGVLENAENVMKGYKTDKNLVINNIKDSVKSSNKTGWGKGSSDFLNEKDKRMFAKDKEFYTKTGNTHALEQLEKSKKNAEKNNKWAGLVWDFIGDPTNLAIGTAKNTSKAIAKSGKELLTGTADISTAIKSKHLDDIFFSSKPYEDLKIFDDSGANKIHNQLDNGYNRAVSNDAKKVIKQKVATSSQKPILASFLNELDNSSPYDGKQLRIDGRTLNKKYTQTKDAYIPQIMRNTDEVGDVIERTTRNNHSYQPNLFDTAEEGLGKHLSATKTNYDGMPTYNNHNNSMFATENFNSDYVRKPDPELKTGRYKYENGIKGNIKYDNELYDKVKEYERILDNSDDKTTDLIYDYLQEQEPEVYARLMDGSDLVDEIVDAGRKKELINDNYTRQFKEIEKKAKKEKKLNIAKEEKLREENAIEKLVNIFERKNTKSPNSIARKYEFSDNIKDLADKISRSTEGSDEIKAITKKLKGDSISKQTKREQINNLLFGGREIITNRVSSKDMDELLTSIDEIIDVKKAQDWYNETGEIINVSLSASTRKMLGVSKNKKIDIENIDVNKLVQTLNNKSRSYSDSRYPEKLELLANVYQYKNKGAIEKRIEEIPKELKALDKQPLTQEVLNAKTELSKELKTLKQKLDDRNLHWKQIRNLSENDFDKYISENYPEYMRNMQVYKHQTKKHKEIKAMDNLNGYDEAVKETGANYQKQMTADRDRLARQEKALEIQEVNKIREHLRNKLGLEYVSFNKVNIPEGAKQTYESLSKTKGVKEAFSNIKKLMSEELNFRLEGRNKYASITRDEMKFYIKKLRESGVKDDVWFGEFKKLKEDMYKHAIESAKPSNPLEKLGVTINGKTYGKDLTGDELQYQFLRSQGAKSLDELFELDAPDVVRSGDNIGSEIGNMLRPNNKTPLDNVKSPVEKVDDYINDFEKFNAEENLADIKKLKESQKDVKQIETIQKPTSDEIDEILNQYSDVNVPKQTLDDVEIDTSRYGNYDENGVLIKNKIPSFKDFKSWLNDGELMAYQKNDLYDFYKSWLNSYKKGLTVYNPGWHVQNYFQNKGQNYLTLGVDAFKPQTQARQIIKEIKGKPNKAKNIAGYTPQEIAKMVEELGIADGLGKSVQQTRGIFPKLENQIDNTSLMRGALEIEPTARIHHFLTQLERGMTPEQAVKSVNDTLFDYSKANKVDKVISDFIDPFWTFHKNNATLMGRTALENPGKLNKSSKITRNLVDMQEEELEQYEGKINSNKSFVDDVNGDSYHYLYNQQMMPQGEDAIPLGQEAMENKMNPIVRLLLQQSRGEGNFGNKIVDSEEAGWNEVTKEDRFKEILSELNPFVPMLSKTLAKTDKYQNKADEGKQSQETSDEQILMEWINLITGNKGNYYRNY